jgi:cell division protein FtsB
MEMMSAELILVAVMVIGIVLAAIGGGVFLLMWKSGRASSSSEVANLRQEIARLSRENERLHEEVEQFKSGPKPSGSTDIRAE